MVARSCARAAQGVIGLERNVRHHENRLAGEGGMTREFTLAPGRACLGRAGASSAVADSRFQRNYPAMSSRERK